MTFHDKPTIDHPEDRLGVDGHYSRLQEVVVKELYDVGMLTSS